MNDHLTRKSEPPYLAPPEVSLIISDLIIKINQLLKGYLDKTYETGNSL